MRLQYAVMVGLMDEFGGDKGHIPVLNEPFEVRQGQAILSDRKGMFPLQLYAGSLSDMREPVDSLENQKPPPSVHKTYLVRYHANGETDRRDLVEGLHPPIDDVADLDSNTIKSTEPDRNGPKIRICCDLAMQAIARGVIDSPTWKSSQIDQFKTAILYGAVKPRDKERLAAHVRDFIAEILNTQLPAKLPSLASLSKQYGDSDSIPGAVEALIDSAETELKQQTLLSPLVSFNPVTCPANIAQLTARLEKALLSQTEAQTYALDNRIQQMTANQDPPTTAGPAQEADVANSASSIINQDDVSTSQQATSQTASPMAPASDVVSSSASGVKGKSWWKPSTQGQPQTQQQELQLNNVFAPMREGLHSIATSVNQNLSTAQRNFATSTFSGAIGAGLIVFYGIDMSLGACIFAAVVGVSNYRFKKAAEKEWLRFCRERVRLAQQSLDKLKSYLQWRSAGEVKKAAQRYDRKVKELDQTKQYVRDARKILLQMAPELKSRFPQWQ
ncbi:hypothetical protein TWF696_003691 [Orbilia brochopaga]